MAIQGLSTSLTFPDPKSASKDGLLAYGGDLSAERLIAAYSAGIFPWYDEYSPDIMWWSPDPRMIIYPEKFKLSKSLKQKINRGTYELRMDTAFEEVIKACAQAPREDQDGTWILDEIIEAYTKLHRLGLAHSIESWKDGELLGGLYGVSLGKAFFGESMFHKATDASKVAFYHLCEVAKQLQLEFIDCQMTTDHLLSLGAEEMSRIDFLEILKHSQQYPTNKGNWHKSKLSP